jgi:hypothetical protein
LYGKTGFISAWPLRSLPRSLQRSLNLRRCFRGCPDHDAIIFPLTASVMAPPTKRQRQIRRLTEERKQRVRIEQVDIELFDDFVPTDDIEFGLDGILSNPVLLNTRLEDLLKWNLAAEHSLRAAYNGDSRATKFRRAKEKQNRDLSVADCSKIDTFFARKAPLPL